MTLHKSTASGAVAVPSIFAGHPRALVESSLERVLASDVFRRSERHRRFVRHVVHAVLDDRRELLKEVLLGIALFDRALPAYDPRQDPIVRVEAGRVREKLARYYQGEGAADAFAFVIPVGSYVPRFERKPAAPSRPVESFAILPFATSSARTEDVAFATALADQLIDALGRVRDLKVVARVSAFKARERDLAVPDIGRLLQVTRLVDGSLQRQGDRLRCIAHIYRAKDGVVLWSKVFDSRAMPVNEDGAFDPFAFQDHVADSVFAAASEGVVEGTKPLGVQQRPHAAANAPTSDERRARDLLDRARYLTNRYDARNAGREIELLEEAIGLDDQNPEAHLALAAACISQIALLNAPASTLLPRVRAAAARVALLDPANPEVLGLQASIAARFDFDWPRASRLFHRALRLAPHASAINFRFATGLLFEGEFDEALRHMRLAIELDPLNLALRASLVQMLAYAGHGIEAEAEAAAILQLEPGQLYVYVVRGFNHLYRRDPAAALRCFDVAIAALPDHPAPHFNRICALGLQGDVARGRDELDRLLTRLSGRHCPSYSLATAYVGLGDGAAACAALGRAIDERDPLAWSLPVDPLFVPLHDDAGFLDLLRRHGIRQPVVAERAAV